LNHRHLVRERVKEIGIYITHREREKVWVYRLAGKASFLSQDSRCVNHRTNEQALVLVPHFSLVAHVNFDS
jgi:hypothetical protein